MAISPYMIYLPLWSHISPLFFLPTLLCPYQPCCFFFFLYPRAFPPQGLWTCFDMNHHHLDTYMFISRVPSDFCLIVLKNFPEYLSWIPFSALLLYFFLNIYPHVSFFYQIFMSSLLVLKLHEGRNFYFFLSCLIPNT